MRNTLGMLAGLATLLAFSGPAPAADSDRVSLSPDQSSWARWQGRLSLGSPPVVARPGLDDHTTRPVSASLMGDYYFGRSLVGSGSLGGFRATSGVIFGPRAQLATGQPGLSAGSPFSIGSRLFGQGSAPYGAEPVAENATLPYVGVGYTGLSVRSGWSFSADLGLVAQSPGGLKVIRNQSFDDMVRELRLAPLVQVGVSYAF